MNNSRYRSSEHNIVKKRRNFNLTNCLSRDLGDYIKNEKGDQKIDCQGHSEDSQSCVAIEDEEAANSTFTKNQIIIKNI